MSLSISWIIFSKSPRFEQFSEESALNLSKVPLCAKTASLAASEPCFSEVSVAGLGGWGDSADVCCSLAEELVGFGSLGWDSLLYFFSAKKPLTKMTFFLELVKGGARSQDPNCCSSGLRLPSLSIHFSQSLSLCERQPHQ